MEELFDSISGAFLSILCCMAYRYAFDDCKGGQRHKTTIGWTLFNHLQAYVLQCHEVRSNSTWLGPTITVCGHGSIVFCVQ